MVLKKVIFCLRGGEKQKSIYRKKVRAAAKTLGAQGILSAFWFGQAGDTFPSAEELLQLKELLRPGKGDQVEEASLSQTLFAVSDPSDAALLSGQGRAVIGLISSAGEAESFNGMDFLFQDFEQVDADSYVKAYQRLTGQPWEILRTRRCILRETTLPDVDRFYEIYREPSMTAYMEGLFPNPEDEKRYTKDYIDKVYGLMGFGVWTVILKADGQIIGRAGYSLRGGFTEPELGFLIAVPYQHQGYAKEVCKAILDYGRDVLFFKRVQALVKPGNHVSIHLLRRLGFAPTGQVEVEEKIYGKNYAPRRKTSPENSSYGAYLRMIKDL